MSLIFKILLIILLAAPVVAYAGFLLIQILQYTGRLNTRANWAPATFSTMHRTQRTNAFSSLDGARFASPRSFVTMTPLHP